MNKILVLLVLSGCVCAASCHIDKQYSLKKDNINYEVNAGQQVIVPIGNFPTIKIKKLLSKQAEQYFDFEDEQYCIYDPKGQTLTDFDFGYIEIAGLSFVHLERAHIPSLKFFMDIENTLPYTFEVSCRILDSLGVEAEGITSVLNAHLEKGTEEVPVSTPAVLQIISYKELRGIAFDGMRFSLTVKKMPDTKLAVKRECGLTIKNVRLQLPGGINFRIKKPDEEQD